jgi:hypothetical protein
VGSVGFIVFVDRANRQKQEVVVRLLVVKSSCESSPWYKNFHKENTSKNLLAKKKT